MPTVIGYQEFVSLPAWGIDRLLVKSDSGARSSALDAKHIEELPGDRVRFEVVLSRTDRDRTLTIEAPIVRRTKIRPSHGETQHRLIVAADLAVGGVTKTIEVSLVSRQRMICRMLLGRTALADDFLVDCGSRFLLSERRIKRAKTKRPAPPAG